MYCRIKSDTRNLKVINVLIDYPTQCCEYTLATWLVSILDDTLFRKNGLSILFCFVSAALRSHALANLTAKATFLLLCIWISYLTFLVKMSQQHLHFNGTVQRYPGESITMKAYESCFAFHYFMGLEVQLMR